MSSHEQIMHNMTEAQKSHLEDGSDPVASVNILVSVLHQSQKSGQFF